MNADQHVRKAHRILAGMKKLDDAADTLAIIDGTMLAGYHLGSIVLHRHGVTDASVHFNTPSKFEVPVSALPAAVLPAYETFAKLEALRTRYVRSANEPDAGVAAQARGILRDMAKHCGIES